MTKQVEFPLKLHKPGSEWLVELRWRISSDGTEAVCGLFYSKDEATAKAFYDNAHRIISCWYVDQVWSGKTQRCQERHAEEGQCELRSGHDGQHLAGTAIWGRGEC